MLLYLLLLYKLEPGFIGANPTWRPEPWSYNIRAYFNAIKQAKFKIVSEPFHWAWLEPEENSYNYSQKEAWEILLDAIYSCSLEVYGGILSAPYWATVETSVEEYPGVNCWAPDVDNSYKMNKFKAYVESLVTWMKPGGQFASKHGWGDWGVKVWDVWNEPNAWDWFCPYSYYLRENPDLAYTDEHLNAYITVLKTAYNAIKEIDSNAIVLIGGIARFEDTTWIKALYEKDPTIKNYFDCMNIHPYWYEPYGTSLKSLERLVKRIKEIMESYGDTGKMIWITEYGWPAGIGGIKSEEEKAMYFVQVYRLLDRIPFISKVIWFQFVDWPHFHHHGIGERFESGEIYPDTSEFCSGSISYHFHRDWAVTDDPSPPELEPTTWRHETSAKKSLKIDTSADSIVITFWMKTLIEKVEQNGGAKFFVYAKNEDSISIDYNIGWTKFRMKIPKENLKSSLWIKFGLFRCAGEAWFDSLKIKEYKSNSVKDLFSENFENPVGVYGIVDRGLKPKPAYYSAVDSALLAKPDSLKAQSLSYSEIKLTWKDYSCHNTKYEIWYKPAGGNWQVDTIGDTTSVIMSNLDYHKTYYFKVRAIDNEGNFSSFSDSVECEPFYFYSVSNLSVDQIVERILKIEWDYDKLHNGFYIYGQRELPDGDFFSAFVPANSFSYITDSLSFGEWHITVKAIYLERDGDTIYSEPCDTSAKVLPNAPSNFVADAIDYDEIELQWKDNSKYGNKNFSLTTFFFSIIINEMKVCLNKVRLKRRGYGKD